MALDAEDLLLLALGGVALYGAKLYLDGDLSSSGDAAQAPPETPPETPPTMDDLVRQLYATDSEMSRVVGDVSDDDPDWLLTGDFRDALFYKQMWLPASRINLSDLTPADLALAIVFLGCVPDAPRLPKGSAGSCPLTKFEEAINKVNAKYGSEADAAGGVGSFLNIVASIFGVDTKEFDKNYGLGRAKTEILKAKFDLSQLQGASIGDLKRVLSWDTPLERPTSSLAPPTGNITINTYWRPRFYEVRCLPGGQWVAAKGAVNDGGGNYDFLFPKNGQLFLTVREGKYLQHQTGTKAGFPGGAAGYFTGKGTKDDGKWIDAETRCMVTAETRPDFGPAFRPGLFQLEKLTNKPSAGTIDHSSSFSDYGEWLLPWNSPQLGCAGTLRQRIYKRARIYRALDFLACRLFPVDPSAPATRTPWGTKTVSYFYGADGAYLIGGPPKLYWYTTSSGVEMKGSIFPPNEPAVVIGKGDGAPRAVTAPGGSTADVVKVTAAPAPARAPSGTAPAPAPAPAPSRPEPLRVAAVSDRTSLAAKVIQSRLLKGT